MGKYVWVTAGRVDVQSASHVIADRCSYAAGGLGEAEPAGPITGTLSRRSM